MGRRRAPTRSETGARPTRSSIARAGSARRRQRAGDREPRRLARSLGMTSAAFLPGWCACWLLAQRPAVSGGIGHALAEVTLGVCGFGEQPAGAGGELLQPRAGRLVKEGKRAAHERPGLELAFRAHRGGGEVGDPEVGGVVVQRPAVGVEELAELRVGGQVAAFGQRREAGGVQGPRRERGSLPRRRWRACWPAAAPPGRGRRAWRTRWPW